METALQTDVEFREVIKIIPEIFLSDQKIINMIKDMAEKNPKVILDSIKRKL